MKDESAIPSGPRRAQLYVAFRRRRYSHGLTTEALLAVEPLQDMEILSHGQSVVLSKCMYTRNCIWGLGPQERGLLLRRS